MLDLPPSGATERQLVDAVRQLIRGRSNAVHRVTLGAGTSTTFQAETINGNALAFLSGPASVGAHASVTAAGVVTITHPTTAAGQTVGLLVIGG